MKKLPNALIEKQNVVNNGEIAVVIADDEGITLKRFYKESNCIRLEAENPAYKAKKYKNVRILGRLVYIMRSY